MAVLTSASIDDPVDLVLYNWRHVTIVIRFILDELLNDMSHDFWGNGTIIRVATHWLESVFYGNHKMRKEHMKVLLVNSNMKNHRR